MVQVKRKCMFAFGRLVFLSNSWASCCRERHAADRLDFFELVFCLFPSAVIGPLHRHIVTGSVGRRLSDDLTALESAFTSDDAAIFNVFSRQHFRRSA